MLFDEYSNSTSSTQLNESCSHSSFHLSSMTVPTVGGKGKEQMDGFSAFDVSVCFLLIILHSLSLNLIL